VEGSVPLGKCEELAWGVVLKPRLLRALAENLNKELVEVNDDESIVEDDFFGLTWVTEPIFLDGQAEEFGGDGVIIDTEPGLLGDGWDEGAVLEGIGAFNGVRLNPVAIMDRPLDPHGFPRAALLREIVVVSHTTQRTIPDCRQRCRCMVEEVVQAKRE
jgi:hypothetical protein